MNHAPRIRFDWSISIGHVVSMTTVVGGLLMWGTRLESRVDHEESLRARLELRVAEDARRDVDAQNEIKGALRDMASKLDRVLFDRMGERNRP